MVRVTVLKPFFDLEKRVNRAAGDSFDTTEERAAHIASVLPEYVTYASETEDLSRMTVPELKALCAERGIAVPKAARKAELIALLEG